MLWYFFCKRVFWMIIGLNGVIKLCIVKWFIGGVVMRDRFWIFVIVNCNVWGIGVVVNVKIWIFCCNCLRCFLWVILNFCFLLMMIRLSFLNWIFFVSKVCVLIIILICLFVILFCVLFVLFVFISCDNWCMVIGYFLNWLEKVWWCCCVSNVVGVIMVIWRFFIMVINVMCKVILVLLKFILL